MSGHAASSARGQDGRSVAYTSLPLLQMRADRGTYRFQQWRTAAAQEWHCVKHRQKILVLESHTNLYYLNLRPKLCK